MMPIELGRYDCQVLHQQLIAMARVLKELVVIVDVIDAGENLLKVSKTELLLLKVQNNRQIVLTDELSIRLANLAHQLAKVCVGWQVIDHVFIILCVLSIES